VRGSVRSEGPLLYNEARAGWGLLAGIVGSVAAAAESAAPPAPAVLSATAGAPPAATTGGASWTANSLTLRRRCHLKPNKDTTPWEAATSAISAAQ